MEKKEMSLSELNLRISQATESVRKKYTDLLNERRAALIAKKELPDVSLEEREKIFDQALQVGQYGNADSKKMARDWDSYDKREPVGGAQTEKDD